MNLHLHSTDEDGTTDPDFSEGLWIRSEVTADGSYGVALKAGPGCSLTLGREQAIAYAVECIARATEAEHDAAVLRLLAERLELPVEVAAEVVVCELRPDRPDGRESTAPLHFASSVVKPGDAGPGDPLFVPVVKVALNGEELGKLSPDAVRRHAGGVLDLIAAADLDNRLFRYLTERVGLRERKARAVVYALSEFMPDNDIDKDDDKGDENE